jgi:signal peptidase I
MATTKVNPRRQSNAWVENIKTIIYAGLIAVGVRTVLFEPFNIPSGSMIPTLLVGDYLFVAKYSYGYSTYSLPFAPPLFSGRIFGSLPKRGDVVVFKYPHDTSVDYIKRIVGLPGDRIQVKQGQLYINGEICPRQPEGEYLSDDNGIKLMSKLYQETLPNGVKHDILKQRDDDPVNNTQEYLVPPGHVFAMGDNRDNSLDSRVPQADGGVCYVPVENLMARADVMLGSYDYLNAHSVRTWLGQIRLSRFLRLI